MASAYCPETDYACDTQQHRKLQLMGVDFARPKR